MFCFALLSLLENSDSLEVHILSGGSKLQIARSQHSDSGNYTCIASNMEGKAQKNYILSIQGKWGRGWAWLAKPVKHVTLYQGYEFSPTLGIELT